MEELNITSDDQEWREVEISGLDITRLCVSTIAQGVYIGIAWWAISDIKSRRKSIFRVTIIETINDIQNISEQALKWAVKNNNEMRGFERQKFFIKELSTLFSLKNCEWFVKLSWGWESLMF